MKNRDSYSFEARRNRQVREEPILRATFAQVYLNPEDNTPVAVIWKDPRRPRLPYIIRVVSENGSGYEFDGFENQFAAAKALDAAFKALKETGVVKSPPLDPTAPKP